jgi:hypothetical protein
MCIAGLKVQSFQLRTEPIRLFNISNFPSIVKDELVVLQQGASAKLHAETRITYDTLLCTVFIPLLSILNQIIISIFHNLYFPYILDEQSVNL